MSAPHPKPSGKHWLDGLHASKVFGPHFAVARRLLEVLACGDTFYWDLVPLSLRLNLTWRERVCLAASAVQALDDSELEALIEFVVPRAGLPAPFGEQSEDAEFWARIASPIERREYVRAAVQRLSLGELRGLQRFIDDLLMNGGQIDIASETRTPRAV